MDWRINYVYGRLLAIVWCIICVPNSLLGSELHAFNFLRDQSSLLFQHAQPDALIFARPFAAASLISDPEGMGLFRDIFDVNQQALSDSELTLATENKLAPMAGKRFYQRLSYSLSIPIPHFTLSGYNFLPDAFFAYEKNSSVRVQSSQSVDLSLLEIQRYGFDFLIQKRHYQSWFASIYRLSQNSRFETFSSDYISGRKRLYTFEDATQIQSSMRLDLGWRRYFNQFNIELRAREIEIQSSTAIVSDPIKSPLFELALYRDYEASVGKFTAMLYAIGRDDPAVDDIFKLQLDFFPTSFENGQFTLRQGVRDTLFQLAWTLSRQEIRQELAYQFKYYTGKLEGAKQAASHQLSWNFYY